MSEPLVLVTPTDKTSRRLSEFEKSLCTAENTCREIENNYDKAQIQQKIDKLSLVQPSDATYKNAQFWISKHKSDLEMLTLAQSVSSLTDYMHRACEYIGELEGVVVMLEKRVAGIEGFHEIIGRKNWFATQSAASSPSPQSASLPPSTPAP